jgi:hypothetical protein
MNYFTNPKHGKINCGAVRKMATFKESIMITLSALHKIR